ncbi:MAG: flagellar assembly protein FliW [Pseudomonadota bacterium]|jgi:flagellar assembly factor FliW|nr:flagellar assembly protein FliW [Alphaproteobacteria bacterium]
MTRPITSNLLKRSLSTKIGELEYSLDDIFYFKNGIFGFNNLRNFIVAKLPGNTPDSYMCLQSMEQEDITLIIADAAAGPGGKRIIDSNDLKIHLQARGLGFEDVAVFLVTTVYQENGKERICVNTKAPIILAPDHKEGWQVVLDNDRYEIIHYLA